LFYSSRDPEFPTDGNLNTVYDAGEVYLQGGGGLVSTVVPAVNTASA